MGRPVLCILLVLVFGGVVASEDSEPTKTPKPEPRPKTKAQVNAEAKLAYRKLRPEIREELDSVIKALVADANAITDVKANEPCFTRPHPAIAGWGPEMAVPVAIRIREKFAGNVYRDTFVRWHLMWAVRRPEVSDADRQRVMLLTNQLADSLPGDQRLPHKPTFRREPEGAYQKWASLYSQVNLVVGYPPFQKYVGPPDSLALMSPSRREKAEVIWEQCQALEDTWKTVTYPDAQLYNKRVGKGNHIVREYQGQLIAQLVGSGDPQMLKHVMRLIDKHARDKSIIGFDLLTYVYLAAFEGKLQQYDPKVLREAGTALERTAKATKGNWVEFGHSKRNFSDYAFHLIRVLKEGDASEMD